MKNLIKHLKINKTYIVAEISSNHNGSLNLAKKLIIDAKKAGADCVKFQLFEASKTIIKKNLKINIGGKKFNQANLLKQNELSKKKIKKLYKFSKQNNIDFAVTATENDHVEFLNQFDIPFIKIASADIINLELIEHCIKKIKNKFLIFSTGMAKLNEINEVIKLLNNYKFKNFIMLHCISLYPTKIEMANLRKIEILKNKYKCFVGYSDHTKFISSAINSVNYSSVFLEKHFCDEKINSIDKDFSTDKNKFEIMVQIIRDIEIMNNSKYVEISKNELNMIKKFRKGVYTNSQLKKNQIIERKNLRFSRPFNGFKISDVKRIIGKKLIRNIPAYSSIKLKDFK